MTPNIWRYRLRFAAHAGIVRQQLKGVLQFGGLDFCLPHSKLLIAKEENVKKVCLGPVR
jgi:hypothetical protein